MDTYVTMWTCKKCHLTVPTRQKDAGFILGYGRPTGGYCPVDGYSHEWEEAIDGHWE